MYINGTVIFEQFNDAHTCVSRFLDVTFSRIDIAYSVTKIYQEFSEAYEQITPEQSRKITHLQTGVLLGCVVAGVLGCIVNRQSVSNEGVIKRNILALTSISVGIVSSAYLLLAPE